MAESESDVNKDEELTVAGHLLVAFSLAVIVAAAVWLVTKFHGELTVNLIDNEGGHAWLPIIAGAVCYAIGTKILMSLGVPVWKKSNKESSNFPKGSKASQIDNR